MWDFYRRGQVLGLLGFGVVNWIIDFSFEYMTGDFGFYGAAAEIELAGCCF